MQKYLLIILIFSGNSLFHFSKGMVKITQFQLTKQLHPLLQVQEIAFPIPLVDPVLSRSSEKLPL